MAITIVALPSDTEQILPLNNNYRTTVLRNCHLKRFNFLDYIYKIVLYCSTIPVVP